jgi:hypothetical protein
MKNKLAWALLAVVLAGCATLQNPGTAPELTDFAVMLQPDVNNPVWAPQNEFTTFDEIQTGVNGADPDKDIRRFVFTVKRNDGTVFLEKEFTLKIGAASFTHYFGHWIAPAGAYTVEVYAVDRKGNKSNTLKADFTVIEKDPNSVGITNITGLSGRVGVWVFAELPQGDYSPTNTAIQSGNISNGSVTVDLVVPLDNTWNANADGKPRPSWAASGEYYVAIVPISENSYRWENRRIYTGGGSEPAKVTFSGGRVALDFGQFTAP